MFRDVRFLYIIQPPVDVKSLHWKQVSWGELYVCGARTIYDEGY